MPEEQLIQYVFGDGHEEIADQKGKLVAIRDPKHSLEYLPLKGSMFFIPRVKGSAPNLDSLVGLSDVPKVGEYLVCFKGFIFGSHYLTHSRIIEIIENFNFDGKPGEHYFKGE